jgi:hypothetical protein
LPQTSWFIFHETKDQSLTEGLKPLYPGARWEKYRPLFTQEEEPTLVETWSTTVLEHLSSLPREIKKISSRSLKLDVGADEVADATWKRVMDTVIELTAKTRTESSYMGTGSKRVTPWKREGRSMVRIEAGLFGFEAA